MKASRYISTPLFPFCLFAFANSLLAYGDGISIQIKWWIFFAGILTPFLYFLFSSSKIDPKGPPIYRQEFFSNKTTVILVGVLLGAATLLRLLQMTSWASWPTIDDSVLGYYSIQLSQKWKWSFFFGSSQHPPLFNWILALFYKFLSPSLFSTRLFSMLLSMGLVGLTYPISRLYFSRSMSLFCLFATACSFWPLWSAQFCSCYNLLLLWEILLLGILGILLCVPSARTSELTRSALFLGFWTGGGLFLVISWPVVLLMTCLLFFHFTRDRGTRVSYAFIFPLILCIGSFIWMAMEGRYGTRILSLGSIQPGENLFQRSVDSLSNITALFWGVDHKGYAPTQGGMLNPALSSLFFLGIIELRKIRDPFFYRSFWFAFLLLLCPGLVSSGFDITRDTQVFPLLVILSGLGFQAIASSCKGTKRLILIGLILLSSTALDLRHYLARYSLSSPESAEFSRAYQILRSQDHEKGPGYFLLDLRPNVWDRTLWIATFPFNAINHASDPLPDVKWAAVIVNESYRSLLDAGSTGWSWSDLGPDELWKKGNLVLGILPLNENTRPKIDRWLKADLYFRSIVNELMDNEPFESPDLFMERLDKADQWVKNDRFLESVYYEKRLLAARSVAQRNILMNEAQDLDLPLPLFPLNKGQIRPDRPNSIRVIHQKALGS